jgi:hypothetical protein
MALDATLAGIRDYFLGVDTRPRAPVIRVIKSD